MKLHLLRHAKTDPKSETGRDFDRKLLPKGTQQSLEISDYLEKLENFEVHCSSSMRTRQTYELVSPKIATANVHFWDDLYHASHMDLLSFLNSLETGKDILLIGHNEGISDLATYLSDHHVALKTCGYICLEADISSWAELSKGIARITDSYRPEVGVED
ncbi:MAG: hypothetical protein K0R65_1566 [Crocinitomicaceae bacterium]|jgi:phosphohistidine phosphatase|nr:hypothetical protein [Crocinitomicaceae bacterium]